VNEPDVKVRRQVAAEHGLNWQAATFLVGSTIPELEESAAKLADLLGKQPQPEQQRPPSLFEIAAAEKAERKQTLVNALCGRFPQTREEQGRFADKPADFSRGARRSVPPPPQTHESWLADALGDRRADVGADF
jgi:hypothetical protein